MTDQNQEEKKETPGQQNEATGEIHGRLDNTANPDYQKAENQPDISQVDRQEGTMNNGELGGNFTKESNENS